MPDHDAITQARTRARGRLLQEEGPRADREDPSGRRRRAGRATISAARSGSMIRSCSRSCTTLASRPIPSVCCRCCRSFRVAWAEGGITKAERELILRLARSRGIEEGSAADHQLTEWLTSRPPEAVFAGARRLIRAMLDSGSAPDGRFQCRRSGRSLRRHRVRIGRHPRHRPYLRGRTGPALQHRRRPERTQLLTRRQIGDAAIQHEEAMMNA